VSFTDM